MDDDFGTSQAIAVLFDLAHEINRSMVDVTEAQFMLRKLAGVLGLTLARDASGSQEASPFIELLIEMRAELRKERQFALADRVRDRLTDLGVALEDTGAGTEWEYKQS